MAYLGVIDKDLKSISEVKTASDKLLQESKLTLIHFESFQALDEFIAAENAKDPQKPAIITLLMISTDLISNLTQEGLQQIKDKYKAGIVLTLFEDPLKPLKKVETFPIENIIYKPFDVNILQEHLRFAAIPGKKLATIAVHSSKESCEIEKIRRYAFTALSDFSFKIKSKTNFEIGRPYKFYHYVFQNQKKQSAWVKPVYKQDEDYEFIFCAPSIQILANLRKKSNETKEKLKNVVFHGLQKNKDVQKVRVGLEFLNPEDAKNIKDFCTRRFPDIEVVELVGEDKKAKPPQIHLLISEVKYEMKDFNARYSADTLYFHVSNDVFKVRTEAEETLAFETARLPRPLDRHYLSRMLLSYFPALRDAEPVVTNWFTVNDDALFSETIKAQEFSEAAFVYERPTVLEHGTYQEFALPVEDETELKLLKAKIHCADEKPNNNKMYAHQVMFYGIRDNLLKRIRLWMLQAHISKKASEN